MIREIFKNMDGFPSFEGINSKTPNKLNYYGSLARIKDPCIAIVGTRKCDTKAREQAYMLGFEASINGINVVSGLAEGIDQASAWGCVDAGLLNGYKTGVHFAVLGCGLSVNYPSYSAKLKQLILETGGAIISQFDEDYPPMKFSFPERNLVIASIGNETIVVQAPEKSGSLITADFTLQMGKDVYVGSSGLGSFPQNLGTNKLYEEGALFVESLFDIESLLPFLKYKVVRCNSEELNKIRFCSSFFTFKEVYSSDSIKTCGN